jgi:hypothetical protein
MALLTVQGASRRNDRLSIFPNGSAVTIDGTAELKAAGHDQRSGGLCLLILLTLAARQSEFSKLMRGMDDIGHCQVIMATHSPMLKAHPTVQRAKIDALAFVSSLSFSVVDILLSAIMAMQTT